jgi:hypothetical protein
MRGRKTLQYMGHTGTPKISVVPKLNFNRQVWIKMAALIFLHKTFTLATNPLAYTAACEAV